MLIDSVIYCGEIELLKARFEYLNDIIDKFIVIESKTYHNGLPRDVRDFHKDIEDCPYKEKIIYRLIDCNDCFKIPEYASYSQGKAFARENYQRNYISTILKELGPFKSSDKICVCDVDEIPDKNFLREICKRPGVGTKQYAFIGMNMYYYNHTVMFANEFYQPVIALANYVMNHKNISRQFRKTLFNNVFYHNAGWHLSYFIPTEEIVKKLSHFLHHEWYTDEKYKNVDWINEQIRNKRSIFSGRGDDIVIIDKNTIPEEFLKFENFGQ